MTLAYKLLFKRLLAKASFLTPIFLLVVFACTTNLGAYARQHNSPSLAATDEDLPDNFHPVHEYLYRGAKPDEDGLRRLKDMGVTVDIDLCQRGGQIEKEKKICQALGITFISLPMDSSGPTSEQMSTFLKTVNECKHSANHQTVFLHCAIGCDRTGCLIGVYRIVEDRWTVAQAHEEMLKYGFHDHFQELNRIVENYGQEAQSLPVENGRVVND